jgi:pimeloyl-ACP methyl ester carboxylesterase
MPEHREGGATAEATAATEPSAGDRSSGLVPAGRIWDTQRDVLASGVRLRVAIAGGGPPVVLLHGLFVDHSTWDGVAEALARDFHLVAPDLPGFGESEKPSPGRFSYGVDAFAEAIADLYAGLGLGRAAVVGHALGGAVAMTLAARHPELVERLVLAAPLCEPANFDLRSRIGLFPLVGGFVFKQLWSRASFRSFFRATMLASPGSVPPGRIDRYFELFSSPLARGAALATLRATVDTRAVVAHTPRLHTPTLVVWGRQDRVIPAGVGQRLAREIPGARFELLPTGHAPQEEQPVELAGIIQRFLREGR